MMWSSGWLSCGEREEGFELGEGPGGVVLSEDGERVEAAVELAREPHFAAGVGKIVFYGDGLCGSRRLLKEKRTWARSWAASVSC